MCDFVASPISFVLVMLIPPRLFRSPFPYSSLITIALAPFKTSRVDYNLLALRTQDEPGEGESKWQQGTYARYL